MLSYKCDFEKVILEINNNHCKSESDLTGILRLKVVLLKKAEVFTNLKLPASIVKKIYNRRFVRQAFYLGLHT